MLLVIQVMSRLQLGCFSEEKQTKFTKKCRKKNRLPSSVANSPQSLLLDKFIKDKKSPTLHCANLLKTNFLELDNENQIINQ